VNKMKLIQDIASRKLAWTHFKPSGSLRVEDFLTCSKIVNFSWRTLHCWDSYLSAGIVAVLKHLPVNYLLQTKSNKHSWDIHTWHGNETSNVSTGHVIVMQAEWLSEKQWLRMVRAQISCFLASLCPYSTPPFSILLTLPGSVFVGGECFHH
jgi:hypothetical protein